MQSVRCRPFGACQAQGLHGGRLVTGLKIRLRHVEVFRGCWFKGDRPVQLINGFLSIALLHVDDTPGIEQFGNRNLPGISDRLVDQLERFGLIDTPKCLQPGEVVQRRRIIRSLLNGLSVKSLGLRESALAIAESSQCDR